MEYHKSIVDFLLELVEVNKHLPPVPLKVTGTHQGNSVVFELDIERGKWFSPHRQYSVSVARVYEDVVKAEKEKREAKQAKIKYEHERLELVTRVSRSLADADNETLQLVSKLLEKCNVVTK